MEGEGLRRRVVQSDGNQASSAPASAQQTEQRDANASPPSASFFSWIFGKEPPTPEEMAAEVHENLKREYGALCPEFVHRSLRDVSTLAKNEGKFVLVYLHSEDHQDTPAFCKNVLCTDEFHAFTLQHDNIILWAGSVSNAEGYGVSLSLGAASFPFVCLVISTPRGLNIVEKIQGTMAKDTLVGRLNTAVQRNQHHISAIRAEEQFRTEAQILREQQDREYQESLEADRRKAEEEARRQEREEAEARELSLKLQAEAEAARKAEEERKALVETKRARLQGGPTTKGKDTAFIRFQLHNGAKVERLFWSHDTFQTVRDFVDVQFFDRDIAIVNYELATNFPRKSWGPNEVHVTLAEAGLAPQSLLYVQDLDS